MGIPKCFDPDPLSVLRTDSSGDTRDQSGHNTPLNPAATSTTAVASNRANYVLYDAEDTDDENPDPDMISDPNEPRH